MTHPTTEQIKVMAKRFRDFLPTDPDEVANMLEAIAAPAGAKVKPLEWQSFGTMAFFAEAPLFGRIRVEPFGKNGKWTVCFSVPGHCDTFIDGEWETPEDAKAAARAEYERRILAILVHDRTYEAGHADALEAAMLKCLHLRRSELLDEREKVGAIECALAISEMKKEPIHG